MEYVPRENFRTWFSEVGYLYVVVAAFVTIVMVFGSLGRYVGNADLQSGEARTPSIEHLGPEAYVGPAVYR